MSNQAQDIFEQIVDLPAAERRQALDRACGSRAQLQSEVESLLAAHDAAGQFLADPTLDHVAAYSEPPEQAGATIGRYKLLERIGQGGFGDVFMAQQFEPVKRRVALKIIKLGMDTKQVVARFEAERQALALMDHPNIARVFDGGETKSGRPYFVMELVRGDPITQYCDREKLATRDRLALFQQVCQAIQHAHQKGVIHRDIKPTNVLVTVADGEPLVKVIDFGIAKATNTELTERTLFTEFRQLIGTPQYMSPEQAERSGVDIDTRSDIYSLGVLLYEILTGRTPIDPATLKSAVWDELQRMIREDEPTPPSTLLTSMGADSNLVAKARGTELSGLVTTLKGDLDWIVLKALEKDRTRRYGTASELSEDIKRFLHDEPVTATPPSTLYKLRKFARRNKSAIAAAAALSAALLLGLVGTTAAAIWALRERDGALVAENLARNSEEQARQASARAEEQASRARRMAAMVGSPFQDKATADNLARAWLADIERLKESSELDQREILIQQCQLAVWWFSNHGGTAAADLMEQVYERAKATLGPGNATYLALVNADIISHLGVYDADRIADLFTDLVESLRQLRPVDYQGVLPQYAAALHHAGRDVDATKAIDEYLEHRNGPSSLPQNPAMELNRLQTALRQLATWSASHPERLARLEAVAERVGRLQSVNSPFSVATKVPDSLERWEGTLDLGMAKVKLRFEVSRRTDGTYAGNMIRLDRENERLPITFMQIDDETLTLTVAAVSAEIVGRLNEQKNESVGKWKQSGRQFDLTIALVAPARKSP
jgi:serine/threonine protein kinase